MKQENVKSTLLRTLAMLLMLVGVGLETRADDLTLTFNITCNKKDALEFTLEHVPSSDGTKVPDKPTPEWTQNGDNYTCTITAKQYYKKGWISIGTKKYAATLKVKPASGFAFYENGTVSESEKTLYNNSGVTSNVTESYTVDYVVQQVSYVLKADPTHIASVTADWSANPTAAANFSAAGTTNSTWLTGDTWHVKVTPQTNAKYSVTVGGQGKVADATDAQEFTIAGNELSGATIDVSAAFMPYYSRLTANTVGNGTVAVNGGAAGATATALTEGTPKPATSDTHTYHLTAQPGEGCSFDGWFADEACTERLSSDANYDCTVSTDTHDADAPAARTVYARFSASVVYYSTITVNAIGAGSVKAETADQTTGFGSSVAVGQHGQETAATSEQHTYTLFAQADETSNFMGWYADEACTDKLSEDAVFSYTMTALSTLASAPTWAVVYAKFEAKREYSFTIEGNDGHFQSIKGGTASLEETLSCSPEGATNTTTVAPNYHLQFNPNDGIKYSATLYDGPTAVRTLCTNARNSQTVVLTREELAGKTIVIESQRGYNFTLKADPAHVAAIVGGAEADNEALSFSADGTSNYTTCVEAEYWMQVTAAADNVIYSVKVYNEAGKHVSTPVLNATGTQAFTINRAHMQEGRVEIESVAIPEGGSYFIIKANPNHFSAMNGGQVADPGTQQTYPDPLKYSLDGEINVISNAGKQYYCQFVGKDGVTYSAIRYNADGTTSNLLQKGSGLRTGMTKNGATIVFDSAIDGEEWSYTVIADPAAVQIVDKAVTPNANIPCSLDGTLYTTTKSSSKPEVLVSEDYMWRAWFVPAGIDPADKTDEHILRNLTAGKNDTYQYLDTRTWTLNDHDGGTLYIETIQKVANAKMTITVQNGSASNVKASFGETAVKLNDGANTVDIVDGKMLAISHATNTKKFFHLYMNSDEIKPREIAGEGGGAVTYMYNLGTPLNGDEVVIDVDYPAGPHAVSVVVPEGCEGFIQSVTVDGTAQSNWQAGLSVKGGATVAIQGDKYNYIVNGYTLYGADGTTVIKQGASTEPDYIVDQSVTFDFDVTRIERDKSFSIECPSDAKVLVITNQKSIMTPAKSATTAIAFNDDDNPITFDASYTGSSQSDQYCNWYVNGTMIMANNITFTRTVAEGETLKVEFSTKETTLSAITYTISGLDVFPEVTVNGNVAISGNHFAPDGATVAIKSNEQVVVTAVAVNGTALAPAADGTYTFTVSGDSNVELTTTEYVAQEPRDKAVRLFVSGLDKALNCTVMDHTKGEVLCTVAEGENTIEFANSDLPLVIEIGLKNASDKAYVYLNGNAVEADEDNGTTELYSIDNVNDGDILTLYFDTTDGYEVTLNDEGWAVVACRRALKVESTHVAAARSQAAKAAGEPAGATYYIVTGIDTDDNKLVLAEINGAVAAGTGFLVYGEAGKTLTIPFAADTDAKADTDGNLLRVLFMGDEMESQDGNTIYVYTTQSEGTAFWSVESSYMSTNGANGDIAYIVLADNNAPESLTLTAEPVEDPGITDGCTRALPGTAAGTAWTLSGTRVNGTAKPGLYIVDGKKVLKF